MEKLSKLRSFDRQ